MQACALLMLLAVGAEPPAAAPTGTARVADAWYLPFESGDRSSMATVRAVSAFGAKRRSFQPGHIHSGVDLKPRKPETSTVRVLALAAGTVCSIHLTDPHTTVVVRHGLPDGTVAYSSYKHLAEVFVEVDQAVTHETAVGRLYTRKEARALGGNYDHLHLEIRKRFDDNGSASWSTMNREDLALRFHEPLGFLRPRLKPPPGLREHKAKRFLAAARELLDIAYDFGGRLRKPGEGIDCQGVLFYAAERIGRCGWRSFSVMPTETVAWGELGAPVPGLSPVKTGLLDPEHLRPGDIVLLLADVENAAEPAIGRLDDRPVWVWHTGIHTGDGKFLHADIFQGKVVEESLPAYLGEHGYTGIFATRMRRGPAPKRCRRHRRMRRPSP